jgi:hypothetical protein
MSTMMKKATAKRVLALVRQASANLNESVKIVQEEEPPEVFAHYRKGAGKALGELYFAILEPLLAQHPQMTPSSIQATSAGLSDKNPPKRKPAKKR